MDENTKFLYELSGFIKSDIGQWPLDSLYDRYDRARNRGYSNLSTDDFNTAMSMACPENSLLVDSGAYIVYRAIKHTLSKIGTKSFDHEVIAPSVKEAVDEAKRDLVDDMKARLTRYYRTLATSSDNKKYAEGWKDAMDYWLKISKEYEWYEER